MLSIEEKKKWDRLMSIYRLYHTRKKCIPFLLIGAFILRCISEALFPGAIRFCGLLLIVLLLLSFLFMITAALCNKKLKDLKGVMAEAELNASFRLEYFQYDEKIKMANALYWMYPGSGSGRTRGANYTKADYHGITFHASGSTIEYLKGGGRYAAYHTSFSGTVIWIECPAPLKGYIRIKPGGERFFKDAVEDVKAEVLLKHKYSVERSEAVHFMDVFHLQFTEWLLRWDKEHETKTTVLARDDAIIFGIEGDWRYMEGKDTETPEDYTSVCRTDIAIVKELIDTCRKWCSMLRM